MPTVIREDLHRARSLLRRLKIQVHDSHELRWFKNYRKSYLSRRGRTLDEIGEALWDAGFLDERPCVTDLAELLDYILSAKAERDKPLTLRIAELLQETTRPLTVPFGGFGNRRTT